MSNESNLLAEVREILRPACVRIMRINGGILRGSTFSASYMLYGPDSKGSLRDTERLPDLIGILSDGRWLAIEVENENEKQRNQHRHATKERQRRFLNVVKQAGGIAATVTCIEDARRLAEALQRTSLPERQEISA